MRHSLTRLLNLRPGDAGRAVPLAVYLLLVIACFVVGQIARDALFLGRFPARLLPYADLLGLAVVVGLVAVYVRLGQRLPLGPLIVGSLVFFAALGFFFWSVSERAGGWLYFAVYVWVGAIGTFASAQAWTLASVLIPPREAKRVFGLLGGGATVGGVLGGAFSHAAARRWGAFSLILVVSLLLLSAAVLAAAIMRRAAAQSVTAAIQPLPASGLRKSLTRLRGSAYLRVVASIVCLSAYVTAIAGWQFKALAQQSFTSTNALAAFLGAFNAGVGLLTLLLQALVTSRLLSGLGLGPVLMLLPAALLGGTVGLLLNGGLLAALWLKGSERVFRYSIDRPATELLYLPLPSTLKLEVKAFIDVVTWRLGDALAGLTILVLATLGGVGPAGLSILNLVCLGAWIGSAAVAQRLYVVQLGDSLRRHRLDLERTKTAVLDRATRQLLAGRLQSSDTEDVLYALGVLGLAEGQAAPFEVRALLGHADPEVRRRALVVLNAAGDLEARERVEALTRDPDVGVRSEALLYLAQRFGVDPLARLPEAGEIDGRLVRSAVAAYLAHSEDGRHLDAARLILEGMAGEDGEHGALVRRDAARLLGTLPEAFADLLERLVRDPDLEVAREAIRGTARTRRASGIPVLLERLRDSELAGEAREALASFGEDLLPLLEQALADPARPIELRRALPGVLLGIGTAGAGDTLARHLLEPDAPLRQAVIAALNKLRRNQPELMLDTLPIEAALTAEILGHYRSYQVLGKVVTGDDDPLSRDLAEALERERERIFRLLGLLLPEADLHSAYVSLRAGGSVARGHALDFLDQVLKPALRKLLLPLVDPEVSPRERARIAEDVLGAGIGSALDAVATLLSAADPWLRSCGAYAVGSYRLVPLLPRLAALADDPDPQVRQTARQAQARIARHSSRPSPGS